MPDIQDFITQLEHGGQLVDPSFEWTKLTNRPDGWFMKCRVKESSKNFELVLHSVEQCGLVVTDYEEAETDRDQGYVYYAVWGEFVT